MTPRNHPVIWVDGVAERLQAFKLVYTGKSLVTAPVYWSVQVPGLFVAGVATRPPYITVVKDEADCHVTPCFRVLPPQLWDNREVPTGWQVARDYRCATAAPKQVYPPFKTVSRCEKGRCLFKLFLCPSFTSAIYLLSVHSCVTHTSASQDVFSPLEDTLHPEYTLSTLAPWRLKQLITKQLFIFDRWGVAEHCYGMKSVE